ncbi:MAG: hypothetical protein MGG11_07100 [Trichodesmium sp. MAG_R03]|nr:hypothetical protein [Trichodesmium sp. MAG_R03]
MHNSAKRLNVSKKLTNIPRQSSQANTYLTMYQNVVKKEHLQRELKTVEKRYNEIKEHLDVLNKQTNQEQKGEPSKKPIMNELINQKIISPQSKFKTITLGY